MSLAQRLSIALALPLGIVVPSASSAAPPPAAPTGLAATGDVNRILLDWDDNAEPDLAGYHVYRSLLAGGPYTRLGADTTLIPAGSVWRYDDTGTDLGTTWRQPGFDDSGWAFGPAQLGYGDGDEATVLSFGPDPNNKYPTYYFRHAFTVPDPSLFAELNVLLQRDDGAVVYLNGVEVIRDNMPGGTITYNTYALGAVGGADENIFFQFILPPGSLVAGTNLIAVEIHQSSGTSSDISFDLELSGLADSSTQLLQSLSISASTEAKPQSKVWRHDNTWWTVLPSNSGTWLWRLDGDSWTQVLELSAKTTAHADCKAAGDVTHVLLFDGVSSQLASVEFVPGQPGTYQPWSARTTLADITLTSGVETATIDIDSTGRMWLASDAVTDIEVRYSDPPYSDWSAPIILASGVSSDDICAVTALPDGTAGVLWSNQVTQRFGFRVHVDGNDPSVWSADEVPASQSALDVGLGMADDHLNVAVASDSTLYAAVKTSYDTAGYPKIALLVRRPSGSWDPLYELDEAGTRPIAILNEDLGRVLVVYTSSEGYNDIVYKESSTATMDFGTRQVLMQGSLNNASSTKETYADELVVLASTSSAAAGVRMTFAAGSDLLLSEFVDTAVTPGQTYYYVVTAEDVFGQESGFSNEASATPLFPPPPAAPTGLSATAISSSQIDLSWTDNASDEDGFSIERSLDGASWSEIATVGANVTSRSDSGLDALTTYFYQVRAFNSSGDSGYSNTASATTSAPPAPPALATAVSVDPGQVSGTVQDTHADDGTVQTLTETSTGRKGRAGLVADYTLVTGAEPAQITGLVLQFKGSWTSVDPTDPLVAAVWNLNAADWDILSWAVGSDTALFETDLSTAPLDHIDAAGQMLVRFTDTADIEREHKDALSVDLLAGLVQAGPDLPPAPPGNVQATAGDTLVVLTWEASPDGDVVGYNVSRDGAPIASLGTETSFIDSGLINGLSYTYTVTAVDASSQEGDPSPPESATPDSVFAPRAPADLSATAGSGQVTLTWSGNFETNAVSYQIYRSTASPVVLGPGTFLAQVPHDGAGLPHRYDDLDVDVSETTTLYYVITATDADSDVSAPSGEVSATITVTSPEELVIITAEYASKPKKLTVVATSTLGDTVTLALYGGPDEASIDWNNALVDPMTYEAETGRHMARIRTTSPPAWVGVTSSGGGAPATAPVTVK